MLPNKSHLTLIVKELERFDAQLDKSYNFQEFIDRARVIFSPEIQKELDFRLNAFREENLIDTLAAQNILYKVRVLGAGGKYVLRVKSDYGPSERVPLNISKLEYGLRGLVVWCRKQIIRLIKNENVEFDKISEVDLKNGS